MSQSSGHHEWGRAGVIAVCLLGVLLAGGGVATATSGVYVTVPTVDVSAEEPTVGDSITVTPTIRHSSGASGGFEVTEVTLVIPGQGRVASAESLGGLAPGESLAVPLQTTVERPGEQRAIVRVRGVTRGTNDTYGEVGVVERPVPISVSEQSESGPPSPRVQIETGRAVAGSTVPVNVTVSNGEDEELADVTVRLESLDGAITPQTAVRPSLGERNVTTVAFDVRPADAGETTLKATVRADGETVGEAFQPVTVASLETDVDVYASVTEDNGTASLHYRVTNRGNAPLHDVAVSGQAGSVVLPGASVGTVDASSTETVTIPVSGVPAGTATLTASYTTGGQEGDSSRTVRLSANGATADEAGSDTREGGIPLSGLAVGLIGVVGVTAVAYRTWRH